VVNKKGQAVFIAAIVGMIMLFVFIAMLPTMISMVVYGQTQTDNWAAKFFMALIPVFLFIMILFVTIRIARSE
jgi:hypothetical protein